MPSIEESTLTKGQARKLNALRKSLGDKIADDAFAKWLKAQSSKKASAKPDPVAKELENALRHLVSTKINLGTYGYNVRRSKKRGEQGFVVTKNTKPGS